MEKRYCKLIMVTGDKNNNKYYTMTYDGNGSTFDVEYGRVEQSSIKLTKPLGEWEKLYNSKVKKGYKDRTELVAVTITESKVKKHKDGFKEIVDAKVREFINKMKSYTANLVDTTYSVKADKVSQKQIDTAQDLINQINKLIEVDKAARDENAINILLIDLYGVIPRWIKNVRVEILPHIDIDKVIQQEQDNLDAMASQVQTITTDDKLAAEDEEEPEQKTFLDVLGVTMEETTDYREIDYIIKQLGGYRIDRVYKIDKPVENEIFKKFIDKAKNKKTRFLIHGTRCTSVIPIIQTGLKIRPVGNFAFSGKAYGDGNYFSEHAAKSLNYTGSDKDQILFVYEVHVGNEYIYNGWYRGVQADGVTLSLNGLTSKGYDSTYVKPGAGLQNSEIISYHEHQNRVRYAIHITRNSRW